MDAVSVYVRHGTPMVYAPYGYEGSKEKGFITLPNLISEYRVLAHLLVKDPLHRFHQRWRSEPGKTGVDKFREEIGDTARLREEGSREQWMAYIKESGGGTGSGTPPPASREVLWRSG